MLLVIGGGFAGTLIVRKMRHEFRVVLIDAKEYFEYYPGICRAYADPKEHRKLSRPYQTICDTFDVEFCWGEVLRVDPSQKKVTMKSIASRQVIAEEEASFDRYYDYLAVANGSQYGIDLRSARACSKSSECLWYPTFLNKSISESKWKQLDERFLSGRRRHIESEYLELVELQKNGGSILVVGAGFVGIEFATEVKHFFPNIEVSIVESRDACVNVMPPRCVTYCQDYCNKNGIKTFYNQRYSAFMSPEDSMDADVSNANLAELAEQWGIPEPDRVYMAVGLRPINHFMPKPCLSPGRRGGWITVNKNQEVMLNGGPLPNVFAAGNCCVYDDGTKFPKNAFPGEDMAAVACHNIRVLQATRDPKFGGCFGFCKPRTKKEGHWGWGTGLCATSLGPSDATLVVGSSETAGSGYTVLRGCFAALNKEFVRYSKIDQISGGCFGSCVWKLVH